MKIENPRSLNLENKDNCDKAMERIYAWYEFEIIDRPCIRFAAHNEQYNINLSENYTAQQWKRLWFDVEQVIDVFINSIKDKQFLAETFPVYWPNIGPDAYASLYGSELVYGEVTSWSRPCVKNFEDIDKLELDLNNEYAKTIEELTKCALGKCNNRFLVGYTDLHPGMDCVLAWRGVEQLCFDIIENPSQAKRMVDIASRDFIRIFDHYDSMLKANNQPSVTWMEIPSFEKFHIPSCDFATMMSPQQFNEFALPSIEAEVKQADHNVFHLDGKGVAKNIDSLLELPEITAIQWVQGVGEDEPIMQWLDLIKKIQSAGKGLVLDIKKDELEGFIEEMNPEGMFLCIPESNVETQKAIIKRIEKW